MERLVIYVLKNFCLIRRVGKNFFGFNKLQGLGEIQGFQNIRRGSDEFRAHLNKIIRPLRGRRKHASRHGKDIAVLVQSDFGGDERTGIQIRFNDKDAEREAGDDAVAVRKILFQGRGFGGVVPK